MMLPYATNRKLEYELKDVIQKIDDDCSRYFFLGYCLGIAWEYPLGGSAYAQCMEYITRYTKYRDFRHLSHIERFKALFSA